MKKRLSGLLSFKKAGGGSDQAQAQAQAQALAPRKPPLARPQLLALQRCLAFLDAAVQQDERDGDQHDGEPLPLQLYSGYGDSYAGETSSRNQVQQLETALAQGEEEVQRLLAQRVRTRDLSPHFVALAVRNLLVDHAPLFGYETYDAVMSGSGSDTKKWTALLAPLSADHKEALQGMLLHLQGLGATAERRRLGPRGVSLETLLATLTPLLLNNDPADRDTQMKLKARLGSNEEPHSSDKDKAMKLKLAKARLTRIKQLLQCDFRKVLTSPTTELSRPVASSSPTPVMASVPLVGSVQSRSVKINFPRGASESSDSLETEASMKKKLSAYGEILNIGWKEKFAVVVFSSEESAGRCVSEAIASGLLSSPNYRLKLVAPPLSMSKHSDNDDVNDVKSTSAVTRSPPTPSNVKEPNVSASMHVEVGGDTDDDQSLGSTDYLGRLHEAWHQEEQVSSTDNTSNVNTSRSRPSGKAGNSFHIEGVEDEVSAIANGQQGTGSDEEDDIHHLSNQTLTLHDMTGLSGGDPRSIHLSNIEEDVEDRSDSEVRHRVLGRSRAGTQDLSDGIEEIPLLDDLDCSQQSMHGTDLSQSGRSESKRDIVRRKNSINHQPSLIDIPMLGMDDSDSSVGKNDDVGEVNENGSGKIVHVKSPPKDSWAASEPVRRNVDMDVSVTPSPQEKPDRNALSSDGNDDGGGGWRVAVPTPNPTPHTSWKSATLNRLTSGDSYHTNVSALSSKSNSPRNSVGNSDDEGISRSGDSGGDDETSDAKSRSSTPVPSPSVTIKRELRVSRSIEVHRSDSVRSTEDDDREICVKPSNILRNDSWEENGEKGDSSNQAIPLTVLTDASNVENKRVDESIRIDSPYGSLNAAKIESPPDSPAEKDAKQKVSTDDKTLLFRSLSLEMLQGSEDDEDDDNDNNIKNESNVNPSNAKKHHSTTPVASASPSPHRIARDSPITRLLRGHVSPILQDKNNLQKTGDNSSVTAIDSEQPTQKQHAPPLIPHSRHYPGVSSIQPLEMDAKSVELENIRAVSTRQTLELHQKLQQHQEHQQKQHDRQKEQQIGSVTSSLDSNRHDGAHFLQQLHPSQNTTRSVLALASDCDPKLPTLQQNQLMQRIRLLEAESMGRIEQQRADEALLQQANESWSAEITALKVQLVDTQNRLQAERHRHQEALHQIASQEAELQSLRSEKLLLEEGRESAKATAEREAYSTLLAQQRLIALLESQRDAEAEKAQLLAEDRNNLAQTHRQAVEAKLNLLAHCKKNGCVPTEHYDEKNEENDGEVVFPQGKANNASEFLSEKENICARTIPVADESRPADTAGREESQYLREISDQQLEAYLERRRQRAKQKVIHQSPMSRPLHGITSPSSSSGRVGMGLDYSKGGVTSITSPVPASGPSSNTQGPQKQQHAPTNATRNRLIPDTSPEDDAPAANARKSDNNDDQSNSESQMSAADRAMSQLSRPLQTYHSPTNTRYHHHYHHYKAPAGTSSNIGPTSTVPASSMSVGERGSQFSEALRSQQEMSSRLENNVAAFRQNPNILHSDVAAVSFSDQVPQKPHHKTKQATASDFQQNAALRELSSRIVAPPGSSSSRPSYSSPSSFPNSSKGGSNNKQFPFLSRTSFYSNASTGANTKQQ